MAEIVMRDVSRAGHTLGGAEVAGLPERVTLREVLRARIHGEVAAYNAEPGPVFVGFVQPEDAIRHSDGYHLRSPRRLDADRLFTAAREAFDAGVVTFQVDGVPAALDDELEPATVEEVVAVLQRPVVARAE